MSDQQKIPLSRSLSGFATQKALDEIQKRGAALPGHVTAVSGAIVTVSFDVEGVSLQEVTMPVLGAEYIRVPIQVGDLGVAFPASLYIGGVSGLGGGVADTTLRGNLSTLVWFPIGNKNWSAVDPTAVVLTSANGQASVTISNTGITATFNGKTVAISSSGVSIEGKEFLTHEHTAGTYVVSSSPVTGDSGTVV